MEIRLLHPILILLKLKFIFRMSILLKWNELNKHKLYLLGMGYPAWCIRRHVHIVCYCPTTSARKIVFQWPGQQTIATWFPFYPTLIDYISSHIHFLLNTQNQATLQSTLGPVLTAILEFYNLVKRFSVKSPPIERTNRKRHLCLVYVLSSLAIGKNYQRL